ncbi:hexose kinase [Virgibacillus halodenitrificans]|uniref:hexose kinase n=1 Tax=Virgibacillus halodenitrificans TaxID=1482 RepID=UPI001EED97B0|nr:hexose kinase [Virgibacillus halodenitrificans]MCG1029938.1 hexose kinase [Virgibacillus halodenitrificans]
MILTITLNPSVDISYHLPAEFKLDTVNRVNEVSKTAGGKGLNVTRVLKQLGEDVAATGFLGGNLGEFIHEEIEKMNVLDLYVPIAGQTRNCIAILHEEQQTEILESGPEISPEEAVLFLDKMEEYIHQADYITISGSLPKGLEASYYNDVLTITGKTKTPVLLDTKGELLNRVLENDIKPFLIKPNQSELADLIGRELTTEVAVAEALQRDELRDIPWVVVTMGADGAVVKHMNKLYYVQIPKVKAVNPVGSGDSVIAGFASGLARNLKGEDLIKYGLTMGVLNAMQEKTGHIDSTKIGWCMKETKVEEMNI